MSNNQLFEFNLNKITRLVAAIKYLTFALFIKHVHAEHLLKRPHP